MRTRTALERLAGEFEPVALTAEQAVRVVSDLGAMQRLIDGILSGAAKRVAETSRDRKNGEGDAARVVARATGVGTSEARRAISTAKKLQKLPATAAAVRAGRLSARQAELVADAATRNPEAEAELLAAAAEGLVPLQDACIAVRARAEDETERAARHHSKRQFRMWTAEDGMLEGRFSLAPEVGGAVKAVIERETQRIFRARRSSGPHESPLAYAADAFANLAQGTGGVPKGAKATVHIVIDHGALVRGNACPGERCEIAGVGPVSVAWVREVLGEAFVTAVIKKGRDITTVAHLGRRIPVHLLTAMIVGGRECDVAGCHARGYLELDHSEVDYADGGPAAWWNIDWTCAPDHRKKTQGWKLGPRDPLTGKRTLTPPEARSRPTATARR